MQRPLVLTDIFRGILFGLVVFAVVAVLTRLLTRREPLRRLANPFYVLAFTAGAAIFLRVNPTLTGPAFTPYFHALVLFSIAYLAIKLCDLLLVDFFIARRRKFLPPSILRELISFGLYILALLVIMAQVLQINLMPLLATSAVLSLVAGLALQETLSNFFAGVTLATERPFTPGEWVQVGQHMGQVIEMGWRAVKIELYLKNDYLIVPNSVLAKEQVINFSRPVPVMGQTVNVGVHYRHPPNQVIGALMEAVEGADGVVSKPTPTAKVLKYGDSSIEYQVRYWITEFENLSKIEGVVLSNIWYAFKRHGIEIPFPIRTVQLHTVTEESERQLQARGLGERLALLREVDFLSPLTPEAITHAANSLQLLLYEAGRTVVRQGDEGDSFFLISRGRVGVWVGETDNDAQPVATLGRGQCFGEMSLLTGARRSATVRSLEDSELLVLGKAEFRDILLADPKVVESLSQILSIRQREQEAAVARERGAVHQRPESDPARQLLDHIKSFFGI
ncbi:MAG TPA: mechanosensitive ion channel family protein [Candidatus Methylomirabilis sp.]|nr:mechanosensitive ion channel family protein [Candidatus Methylomirabilis sp.]